MDNGSSGQVDVESSSILQKKSLDSNNNFNPQTSTSDLGETISGHLISDDIQSKSVLESDVNHQYDEYDIADGFSEEGREKVDVEVCSLGDEDEDEGADDEPYDVDKVLISTFLEQTTSIVRSSQLFIRPFP